VIERRLWTILVAAAILGGCRQEPSTTGSVASSSPTPSPAVFAGPPVEMADVPTRTVRAAGGGRAVIWLGLDGLDFEIVDRLADSGKMPNWKRLAQTGWTSRIQSFMPVLSPIIWTTVATGVSPEVHRVLDFQEVDPKTGAKVPITGRSRRVPAVWNLASAAGKKVGVVSWWATHPAEEVHGFFVSDHASPILYEKLPLSGVAYPTSLEAGVGQAVAREGHPSAESVAKFVDVPADEILKALSSGRGMDDPLVALARILGATRVVHRAARELYDRQLPDLTMVYIEGTDEIGHVFAADTPPRLPCTAEADFARFGRTVDEYYAVVDRMLGQWMRRAEEDRATLIVSSDHGFKWGADRSCARSSLNWSTAAYWHRLEGVFAAWGEGVRPGKGTGKPSMFDPAPTVLALLGVPADRGMTGKPIAAAFTSLPALARKEAYAGLEVRRVAAEEMSPEQANEYTKKLLALGYLSGSEARPLAPTGGAEPGMTEGAWNNLGLYERETSGKLAAARESFEKALALRPDYHSPMFNLAVLDRMEGRDAEAREWLMRSLASGHADPPGTIRQWIEDYTLRGKPGAARDVAEAALAKYPDNEPIAREVAYARFRGRDCSGAYAAVAKFEPATREPQTLNALGLFEACLGRKAEAQKTFERSLSLDPNQPGVVQSLELIRRTPSGVPKT
jgi:predicted AlkP superfamily phosphohydrolase/phosphomutase/Flp pilus assembly protein TadD